MMLVLLGACWEKQAPADAHDASLFGVRERNGFPLMLMMLVLVAFPMMPMTLVALGGLVGETDSG